MAEHAEGVRGTARGDEMQARYRHGYAPIGGPGCTGPCEGTGWVPVHGGLVTGIDDLGEVQTAQITIAPALRPDALYYLRAWKRAERACPAGDGWHFVPCPVCRQHMG